MSSPRKILGRAISASRRSKRGWSWSENRLLRVVERCPIAAVILRTKTAYSISTCFSTSYYSSRGNKIMQFAWPSNVFLVGRSTVIAKPANNRCSALQLLFLPMEKIFITEITGGTIRDFFPFADVVQGPFAS